MSGADDAAAALRDDLRWLDAPLAFDGDGFSEALELTFRLAKEASRRAGDAAGANDLDAAMARAVDAIDAAEEAVAAAKQAKARIETLITFLDERAAAARAALARAMADTGAPMAQGSGRNAHPMEPARSVEITDRAAIPHTYWSHPDPVPDMKKIAHALAAGVKVPGVRRVAGPARLQLRQKPRAKEAAA